MSGVTIKGAEYPLEKIFSDDFFFKIPGYQRPYAWTTEEAEELLDDLLAALGDGDEPIDTINPYFLGSIVLIKGDKPDAEVVDGQQRLTTLTILLAVLRASVSDELAQDLTTFLYQKGNKAKGTSNLYRLKLRERDEEFFKKYIQDEGGINKLKELSSVGLSDSQRNIKENALGNKKAVGLLRRLEQIPEPQLDRFAQFIVTRCFLVVVSTPDFDSAYRVFSVMNDRGLDLSPTDILKAKIIGEIPKHQQEAYTAKWEDTELQLSPYEQGNVLKTLDGDLYLIQKIRRYVLLRLDAALSGGEAFYNLSNITVEHVLPQNPGANSEWIQWFPTQEERERYVHRLGNLVLLSHAKNSAAQNYEFGLKKKTYFTTKTGMSPFVLTTQVLNEQEWTPEVIERRQKELIGVLKQVWRL